MKRLLIAKVRMVFFLIRRRPVKLCEEFLNRSYRAIIGESRSLFGNLCYHLGRMIETHYTTLAKTPLFSGLTPEALRGLLDASQLIVRGYAKDQVIAFEEDPCGAIGVVARGSVHIQRIYPSGKSITIETIRAGDSFGEALIFADQGSYPATLIAPEETRVVFITREEVQRLLGQSPRFLENFLRMLSNRILLLNRRIKGLSYTSVRQKVANYLLEEYQRQGKSPLVLPWARHELADALGIPRPSLSREMIAMKDAGWIDFSRREVAILDVDALVGCLEK